MNFSKLVFLLCVLTCSSFALSQNVKVYNCEWKAMRSGKNPNFTAWSSGLKDPGRVTVSEDLVSYGRMRYQRSSAIPSQTRPNGTVLDIYSDGENMINIGYSPDGRVMISLMQKSTDINLVGDCFRN
jgi:hypothetical protein